MALPSATDVEYVGTGNSGGTVLGHSSTELIGFYAATPVARRSGATQSTVTMTLTTGGVGFVTTAQAQAIYDQLNEIRATLTAVGLWAGS